MMTEEEARKKWCPMTRITLETEHWKAMNNREQPLAGDKSRTHCIASNCMMWRTYRATTEKYDKDIQGWVQNDSWEEGYCGLAGKE